jgi:hypothetical protein
MEFALKQFLDYNQDYKGRTVYNLPFWQCNTLDPKTGASFLNIALDKNESRTFILIHKMSYSPSWSSIPTIFTDSRYPSQPLMKFNDTLDVGGIYDFIYISKGNSLKINCTNNVCLFSFFIQIVTQEKER